MSGDPGIVYIDGVNPPNTSLRMMNPSVISRTTSAAGGNGVIGRNAATHVVYAKVHGTHHQRLLQTIREDDCESR